MSKVTIDMVKEAKQKFGEIYVVEVDLDEQESLADLAEDSEVAATKFDTSGVLSDSPNVFRAIVQKPSKKIKGLAMTSKDPIQMGNIILRNSIVEGCADAEILDDDDVNVTAALQVIKFITVGKGTLKKF